MTRVPLSISVYEYDTFLERTTRFLIMALTGLALNKFRFQRVLEEDTKNVHCTKASCYFYMHSFFVVLFIYFILSRLLCLTFSANVGLLYMPPPGMGPLV